jgi:hypothetical protein
MTDSSASAAGGSDPVSKSGDLSRVIRRCKLTDELASYIQARTFQDPKSLNSTAFRCRAQPSMSSAPSLGGRDMRRSSIDGDSRRRPRLFCHKMLRLRDGIPLIHPSDPSRVVLRVASPEHVGRAFIAPS